MGPNYKARRILFSTLLIVAGVTLMILSTMNAQTDPRWFVGSFLAGVPIGVGAAELDLMRRGR